MPRNEHDRGETRHPPRRASNIGRAFVLHSDWSVRFEIMPYIPATDATGHTAVSRGQ